MLESIFDKAKNSSPFWDSILQIGDEFPQLAATPQDPIHHAEGNVEIHTRRVIDELLASDFWMALPEIDQKTLFWAAVFHDSGKPRTTEISDDGRVTAPKHSRVGSSIARYRLRQLGYPLIEREEICSLIQHHQLPFWLFERDNAHRKACMVSWGCNPEFLIAHARADILGRDCHDKQELLDRVELSRTIFEDMGITNAPFAFQNDESRVAFFENEDRSPHYKAHEDFRCEVHIVCGLPGTGKDTWINANLSQYPSISLDRIREELKISPEGNQGRVIQKGFEDARGFLRSRTDFVWNTTNVTRSTRQKIIRLLRDYNARINITYLETTPETVMFRNNNRDAAVPEKIIEKLTWKLEPPEAHEGHTVSWYSDGNLVKVNGAAITPDTINERNAPTSQEASM